MNYFFIYGFLWVFMGFALKGEANRLCRFEKTETVPQADRMGLLTLLASIRQCALEVFLASPPGQSQGYQHGDVAFCDIAGGVRGPV